jgi:propionyl-CoA synthetase
MVYSTFDWGIRDADGYFYILGRTDDVINVAGHRLGTREIEESISSHAGRGRGGGGRGGRCGEGPGGDGLRRARDGRAVTDPTDALKLEGAIMKVVDQQLGALARPSRVRFVSGLPKTRSGKLLRRAIQAVCEQAGTPAT